MQMQRRLLRMLEEDTDPSMSVHLSQFFGFCCKNEITLQFIEEGNSENHLMSIKLFVHEYSFLRHFMTVPFSDLFYPKKLLAEVKEKVDEIKKEHE